MRVGRLLRLISIFVVLSVVLFFGLSIGEGPFFLLLGVLLPILAHIAFNSFWLKEFFIKLIFDDGEHLEKWRQINSTYKTNTQSIQIVTKKYMGLFAGSLASMYCLMRGIIKTFVQKPEPMDFQSSKEVSLLMLLGLVIGLFLSIYYFNRVIRNSNTYEEMIRKMPIVGFIFSFGLLGPVLTYLLILIYS